MIEAIGDAAGTIWRFLNQQPGPFTLTNLRNALPLPYPLLMMGLGWLAREGKLNIEMSDVSYSYRISLRSQTLG